MKLELSLTDFRKILKYHISWKNPSSWSRVVPRLQTGTRADRYERS